MIVGSYLEIYTTLMGWMLFDLLFLIFFKTGLVLIPFIMILYENWKKPVESQDAKAAAPTSSRRMFIDVMIAISVFIFAMVPIMPIQTTTVTYPPPPTFANPNPTMATATNNDTTYADTFGKSVSDLYTTAAGDVRVPILWMFIQNLSSGISSAVANSLPRADDIRAAQSLVQHNAITDPTVANEVRRFASECFTQARGRFERWSREQDLETLLGSENYQRYLSDPEDTLRLNSFVFRNTSGLYQPCSVDPNNLSFCSKALRANAPVRGFNYQHARDKDMPYTPEEIRAGANGRPYCSEWWDSLRSNIQNSYYEDGNFMTNVAKQIIANTQAAFSDEEAEDFILESALRNNSSVSPTGDLAWQSVSHSNIGAIDSAKSAFKQFYTFFAVAKEGIKFSVYQYVIIQVLPMIQAIMMLMLILMTPILLIIGGYRLDIVSTIAIAMFALTFLHALRAIAFWVDMNLIHALYPNPNAIMHYLEGNAGPERWLLDMVTGSMYFALPMVFIGTMTWTGFKVGNGLNNATSSLTKTSDSAGNSAGKGAESRVSTETNKVSDGVKEKAGFKSKKS